LKKVANFEKAHPGPLDKLPKKLTRHKVAWNAPSVLTIFRALSICMSPEIERERESYAVLHRMVGFIG